MMIWKNRPNGNNVFSVTLRLYIFARIFGYWPFSVHFNESQRSSKVYLTILDWLWVIIAISLYIASSQMTSFQHSIYDNFSFIATFVSRMIEISDIIFTIISILLDLINRRRIWNLIVSYSEFDEEVRF